MRRRAAEAERTRRLIAEFVTRTAPRAETPDVDMLTDRERGVMALVAAGMSNAEIGEHLVVSPATARTHVSTPIAASIMQLTHGRAHD